MFDLKIKAQKKFQSTPPARGATARERYARELKEISIHAPREGGDRLFWMSVIPGSQFQSTPPARGATELILVALAGNAISIHAPREGGDADGY